MTFVEAIKSGFKNMTKFQGRSTRSEYWWFFLFYLIIIIVPLVMYETESKRGDYGLGTAIFVLLSLVFLLPTLSLAIRRLHDSDRSGWWLLIGLVPFIGGIVLLVFYCLGSTPGANKYGSGSKMAEIAKTFE